MRRNFGKLIVFLEELLFGYAVYVFLFRFLPGIHFELYKTLDIVLGSIFCALFLLCQMCFARVSLTNPGQTSEKLMQKYMESDKSSSYMTERKHNGEIRVCNKCKSPKPDRAHHCSICNRCILKMDHHCPFVNNCIGFFNYKFFFIFLFWTLNFCFYVTACMVYYSVELYTKDHHHKKLDYFVLVAAFLCVIVAFFVLILFSNHVKFVFRNLTTIEHVEKKVAPSKHPYNLGATRNFAEVFGGNPLLWMLPFWTTRGDGIAFPVQHETSSLLTHT